MGWVATFCSTGNQPNGNHGEIGLCRFARVLLPPTQPTTYVVTLVTTHSAQLSRRLVMPRMPSCCARISSTECPWALLTCPSFETLGRSKSLHGAGKPRQLAQRLAEKRSCKPPHCLPRSVGTMHTNKSGVQLPGSPRLGQLSILTDYRSATEPGPASAKPLPRVKETLLCSRLLSIHFLQKHQRPGESSESAGPSSSPLLLHTRHSN